MSNICKIVGTSEKDGKCTFPDNKLSRIKGVVQIWNVGNINTFGLARRKGKSYDYDSEKGVGFWGPSHLYVPISNKTLDKWSLKYMDKSFRGDVNIPNVGKMRFMYNKQWFKKENGTMTFTPTPMKEQKLI